MVRRNSVRVGQIENSQADKSHAIPLARAVAFAASKGYGFTIEEAKQHVNAKAAAAGEVLSHAELHGMAGRISMEFKFVVRAVVYKQPIGWTG